MKNPRRITVAEAARVMGKDTLFVSELLKQGRMPIGEAERMEGRVRWNYYISPKLLADYIGMTVEELWTAIEEVRSKTGGLLNA